VSHDILASGLRFAYPALEPGGPARWVIDGLDLQVRTGEWLAVMGASDAGKTTLCLLLAGLVPHLGGGTLEGQIVVAGRDTLEHLPPALVTSVGLLFQEPDAQLFNADAEAEIAWGLENLGLPPAEIQGRVDQALDQFGLEPLRHRPPDQLSGGEKKRLALASVLAMQPSVIILDEPMGGLDPAGREQVLEALATLRRDRSATIVMTESDPEAVAAFADRLIVLERPARHPSASEPGQAIALSGTPRDVFQQVDRLADLGVSAPQLSRLAACLNRRLGTQFNFLTLDEALAALVVPLG